MALSTSNRKTIEPFIVGPFASDGLHVIVATHVSGVPIPDGFYRALVDRIPEALSVKLDRFIGSDRHLDIPKNREDWDRCWLTSAGSTLTPDLRITADIGRAPDTVRGAVTAALHDEAHGELRFIVR